MMLAGLWRAQPSDIGTDEAQEALVAVEGEAEAARLLDGGEAVDDSAQPTDGMDGVVGLEVIWRQYSQDHIDDGDGEA